MSKKTTTAKPTKPAKPAKAERDNQNGITRPKTGSKTGTVWEIADALSEKTSAPAKRADVLKQAAAKKINPSTANTQYGKWRKYNGLKGRGND